VSETPEFNVLNAAANYYPYVIEGDEVKALREERFGPIPGTLSATAVGATITPSRHEPGRLPFIQLIATSDTPQHAIDLAQQTADTFIAFVAQKQEGRNIRPGQRLIIRQVRKPVETFAIGGTSFALPMLIVVFLSLVAAAIAFLLDRLFPRTVAVARPVPHEAAFLRDEDEDERLVGASSRRDS
jgi:hypothetical protein